MYMYMNKYDLMRLGMFPNKHFQKVCLKEIKISEY